MALNKKLFNTAGEDTITPSQHFETVLYKGNGIIQKVGSYINEGGVFNGSNSVVTLPITTNYSDLSISCWVKFNALPTGNADATLVFKGYYTSGTNTQYLHLRYEDYTDQFTFAIRENNTYNQQATSGVTASVGVWYHVVGTLDSSGNAQIYVNGSAGTGITSAITMTNSNSFEIGSYGSSVAVIDGVIDQLRLFNKELSSSEVTTLYGETYSSTSKSVTDIFGDRSALALYQFENSAKDTGGASGYLGAGAIFNGSNSYIDISSFDVPTNNFSVSAWVYLNETPSSTTYNMILTTAKQNSGGYFYFTFYGTQLQYYHVAGGTSVIGGTVAGGQWYHAVLTQSSTDGAKLYLNNSSVASNSGLTANTTPNTTSGGVNTIGYYNTGSSTTGSLNGKIDEVRIYSDVLTSTEIGHIYNNTTASIPTDNLEAYYKFEDNAQDEQQQYDGVSSNVIYKFDGTSSNVTFQGSLKFTPDWIWIKDRGVSGANHTLTDSVRGVGRFLISNIAISEYVSSGGTLSAFNTNGFTLAAASPAYDFNVDGNSYTAWCWKGGGAPTASNTNTSGAMTSNSVSKNGTLQSAYTPSGSPSIYPTKMSINTTSGFSIVSYTGNGSNGASIPHGLSSTPNLWIIKETNGNQNWLVGSSVLGATDRYLILDDNNEELTNAPNIWSVDANKITFTTSYGGTNNNTDTYIGYFFNNVNSFQKIGTYTGNGDNRGEVVSTGFEVAWLLIKRVDGGNSSWAIHDNKRSRTNPRNKELFANLSDEENTFTAVDFLTNGFQVITSNAVYNNDGNKYFYWAIAADPSTAATPTVTKSFDVVTWTGDGSNRDIESDISPDLVWGKRRDNAIGNTNHFLFDTLRGVESRLMSNSDSAETVISDEVTGFNTKGFSVGVDPSTNGNSGSMVAWLWSAGSHEGNLPTANTDGGVKSTVTANAAAGFSISRVLCPSSEQDFNWGHGLGAKPDMVLMKKINSTGNWFFWHKDLTAEQNYLYLNSSLNEGGLTQDARIWGNQTFTSTTVSTRSNYTFSNDDDVICYSWAEISGYSSIGSYTGNGNSTGTIVYTTDDGTSSGNNGFKPRFLLLKCINSSGTNWRIIDSMRDKTNARSNYFNADTAQPEETAYDQVDFLDNGFQLRTTDTSINGSGNTMIYYAVK